MTLALAPRGADAPTAVLLLGEAGEGVAAALGEVGTGVTGRPAPPSLPPQALFLPSRPVGPRFVQSPFSWVGTGQPWETEGPVQLDCGFTHRLLGQCVLEAAAQGLLGGWPGVLGLGVRQQVLRGGWALGVRPLDAVNLDRGIGRMVHAHVHHGGRGLHWGGGARWLQGCPAPPVAGAVAHSGPATLVSAHFGHPGSARGPVPSAEICPGPRGTRKAACWAGGPSPGPGGSAITWTA